MNSLPTLNLPSLAATEKLARVVARHIKAGDILGLAGELGAGKTTFVKFLGSELGIKDDITSPTFVLEHLYKGSEFMVSHWDIYRLSSAPQELFEDTLSKGIRIVEWVDKDLNLMNLCQLLLTFTLDTSKTATNDIDSLSINRIVKVSGPKALDVINEYQIETNS